MKTTKTNGNGRYARGDAAHDRNRRIYVLKHFCGLEQKDIASALGLTRQRVQQVLTTHKEPSLWLADLRSAPTFVRIAP